MRYLITYADRIKRPFYTHVWNPENWEPGMTVFDLTRGHHTTNGFFWQQTDKDTY